MGCAEHMLSSHFMAFLIDSFDPCLRISMNHGCAASADLYPNMATEEPPIIINKSHRTSTCFTFSAFYTLNNPDICPRGSYARRGHLIYVRLIPVSPDNCFALPLQSSLHELRLSWLKRRRLIYNEGVTYIVTCGDVALYGKWAPMTLIPARNGNIRPRNISWFQNHYCTHYREDEITGTMLLNLIAPAELRQIGLGSSWFSHHVVTASRAEKRGLRDLPRSLLGELSRSVTSIAGLRGLSEGLTSSTPSGD